MTLTLTEMISKIRQAKSDGEICRDGLSGRCTRGEHCRYIHFDFFLPRAKDGSEYCIADLLGEPCKRKSCGYFHASLGKAPATRHLAPDGRQYCIDYQRGACSKKNCNYYHSFPARIWSTGWMPKVTTSSDRGCEKTNDTFSRWDLPSPHCSSPSSSTLTPSSHPFMPRTSPIERPTPLVIEIPTKDQGTQTNPGDTNPYSLFSSTHAGWCLCETCTL